MAVPAIAVRGGLVAARHDLRGDLGAALDCPSAHIEGRPAAAAIEEIEDPPDPGAQPVLVELLHGQIAHPVRQGRYELAELVVGRLAILEGGLGSFLEIDDEGRP